MNTHIPEEYGGPGALLPRRLLIEEELALGLLRHRHLARRQRPGLRAGRARRLRGDQEGVPRHAHRGAQARLVLPHRARRRLRRLGHAHDAPSSRATSTSSTARSASSPTAATPTGTRSTPRPTRTPATAASPPSSSRKDDTVIVDKKEDKMGQRASNTATITFNDTEVPAREPARRGEHGLQARDDDPRPHAPGRRGDGRRASRAPRSSSPPSTPRSASSSACRSRCTRRSSS